MICARAYSVTYRGRRVSGQVCARLICAEAACAPAYALSCAQFCAQACAPLLCALACVQHACVRLAYVLIYDPYAPFYDHCQAECSQTCLFVVN